MATVRQSAYQILLQFEQNKTRLDVLFQQLNLEGRDQRLARNLVSGSVRHLLYLDWIAGYLYRGNYKKALTKLKVLLRLAFYEIIHMDSIPERASVNEYVNLAKNKMGYKSSQQVNAILRNYLRQRQDISLHNLIKDPIERISIEHSFPEWLVKRWVSVWGAQETEALCKAMNKPPQFDLRVNETLISISAFKALLNEQEIPFTQSKLFTNMVSVSNLQEIVTQGWFDKGYCSVQDESAAIPVKVLDPGKNDRVLDVCAAPGGKYLQILETEPDFSVAVDIDLSRLKRVRDNVLRLKLAGGNFVCADARHLPFKIPFSKILLDAPCSGLGVIRKHPDIKWRRDLAEIVEFSHLQLEILEESSRHLDDGGRLSYSTCTLDHLENTEVVANYLKKGTNKLRPVFPTKDLDFLTKDGTIQTFPHRHKMDGSFCTILEKNNV